MPLFEPEFGPGAPFGDGGVDGFADDGRADAAGGFYFFAGVVEGVRDYCFCAVLVRGNGLRGKGRGIVEFFVVGPIGAAGGGCSVGEVQGKDVGNGRLTWLFWTFGERCPGCETWEGDKRMLRLA